MSEDIRKLIFFIALIKVLPSANSCAKYFDLQRNVKVLCGAKVFIGTNLVLSCRILQSYRLPVFLLFQSHFEIDIDSKSRIAKGLSFLMPVLPKVANQTPPALTARAVRTEETRSKWEWGLAADGLWNR